MDGLRRLGDRVEVAVQDVEDFLDSPGGAPVPPAPRRCRDHRRAVALPAPGAEALPLLRALELAGGAALLVKFAEALRDWEPTSRRAIVIDVPGGSA